MSVKNILCFVGGLVAGAAGGVLATQQYFKKKYQAEADAEIEEMNQYYTKKYEDLVELLKNEDDLKDREETEEVSQGRMSDIREKLQQNYEQTTNYAKMFQGSKEEEEDDMESLLEEEPTEREAAESATEDHNRNKDKPPRIISEEALGDVPSYYESKVLFFYRLDDVVTDEEDNVVDDPEYLLGDCLDKYNFRESEEKLIFVRNYALDTVYEVQKINAAHYDEE